MTGKKSTHVASVTGKMRKSFTKEKPHIEEGIFRDEHWVLYGNQFDDKFHILKQNKKKKKKKKNHKRIRRFGEEKNAPRFRHAKFAVIMGYVSTRKDRKHKKSGS